MLHHAINFKTKLRGQGQSNNTYFSVDGSFGFGIGGIDSIILIPLSILELVSECLHFPDFLAVRPLSKSDPVYSFCESYSGKARDLDDG